MIFNGTIWNYKELRKKLNIKTKTSGDTEVLCAILDKYGIKGLRMVEGMFWLHLLKVMDQSPSSGTDMVRYLFIIH